MIFCVVKQSGNSISKVRNKNSKPVTQTRSTFVTKNYTLLAFQLSNFNLLFDNKSTFTNELCNFPPSEIFFKEKLLRGWQILNETSQVCTKYTETTL